MHAHFGRKTLLPTYFYLAIFVYFGLMDGSHFLQPKAGLHETILNLCVLLVGFWLVSRIGASRLRSCIHNSLTACMAWSYNHFYVLYIICFYYIFCERILLLSFLLQAIAAENEKLHAEMYQMKKQPAAAIAFSHEVSIRYYCFQVKEIRIHFVILCVISIILLQTSL